MGIREAMFSQWEEVDCEDAVGRICASPCVSCPPAIPIAASGEEITAEVLEAHAAEIFDEAENRLHAQKAVMVKCMGDGTH